MPATGQAHTQKGFPQSRSDAYTYVLVSATGYEPDGETFRGNENLGYGFDAAGNLLLRTNNTVELDTPTIAA